MNESRILKDVLAYLPVKILPGVAGLTTIFILTHYLSPSEYGSYSVALTIILLAVQIAGTWLSNSVLYLYSKYSSSLLNEFLAFVLRFQIKIGVPASLLVFVAMFFTSGELLISILSALLVFAQLIQSLALTYLQADRKISSQTAIVSFQVTFQMITLFVLISVFQGKAWIGVAALLFGYAFGLAVAWKSIGMSNILSCKTDSDLKLERRLIDYGIPMCLWFFAVQFNMVGDRIFLGNSGFSKELGGYASFRDLMSGCTAFLLMPMLMATHPILMKVWRNGEGKREVQNILTNGVKYVSYIFIPLMIFVESIGDGVTKIAFGNGYNVKHIVMFLTIFSLYIGALSIYVQRALEITGTTKKMGLVAAITAIFILPLFYLFVPRYGVEGAAFITAFGQLFYFLIIWFMAKEIVIPEIDIKFFCKLACWGFLVWGILGGKIFSYSFSYGIQLLIFTILFFALLMTDSFLKKQASIFSKRMRSAVQRIK
jgi:O-antigen/teichoic acid export membrane protein